MLLSTAELAVAFALLTPALAWWGAVGGLCLLLSFISVVGWNLLLGRHPDCACSGQLGSGPIRWSTLARNVALAGIAGLVVWLEDSAFGFLPAWSLVDLVPLLTGLLVVVAFTVIVWLQMRLRRDIALLTARIDSLVFQFGPDGDSEASDSLQSTQLDFSGLPLNTPAPSFEAPSLSGDVVGLESLCAVGRPVVLVFTDPLCEPCRLLLPEIARWQREFADQLNLIVISRGQLDTNRRISEEHQLGQVLLQVNREVAELYFAFATPSAVVIGPDRTMASLLAQGSIEIRSLGDSVVRRKVQPGITGRLDPTSARAIGA
jgi:thiol-disulfide isomerase/thioredoxin